MKIQDVNAFLAVVKYGSFTSAAEKMFTTQPTISWQISSLEKELGHPLLYRGKGIHQTTLTEAGKIFYPQAQKWAQLWAETEELLSAPNKETYRFCCVPTIAPNCFPAVQKGFETHMPSCALTMYARVSSGCFEEVEHGKFDSGLICSIQPASTLQIEPLIREKMLFVCRDDAPYPEEVRVRDLDIGDYVFAEWTIEMDAWMKYNFGNNVKPYFRASTLISPSAFFSRPEVWMTVPASAYQCMPAGFRICQLDAEPPRRLGYLISKYPQREPHHSFLRSVLIEHFSTVPYVELLATENGPKG